MTSPLVALAFCVATVVAVHGPAPPLPPGGTAFTYSTGRFWDDPPPFVVGRIVVPPYVVVAGAPFVQAIRDPASRLGDGVLHLRFSAV